MMGLDDPCDPIVLDCSRVTSIQDFWTLCRAILGLTAEPEARGLEGLAMALRSRQSPTWVEVHATEAIAEGHADFVRALEALGAALEREQGMTRLVVIRRGPPPRGRLYQHTSFRSPALRDSLIEAARYWRGADGRCSMLWLKPSGRLWQRFFLEVGSVFWEEWGDDTTFSDFEELADDIRSLDELRGLKLGDLEAARFGNAASGLRIGLGGDGALWLLPIDPHAAETDAWLTVALPTA